MRIRLFSLPLNQPKLSVSAYKSQYSKTLWNMKVSGILFVVGAFETVPKDLVKRLGATADQRKNGDNPDQSTVKIS